MAVTFQSNEVIPIENYSLYWRISNPKWNVWPKEALDQLIPLNASASERVESIFTPYRFTPYHGPHQSPFINSPPPFDYELFHGVTGFHLAYTNEDRTRLRKLPIKAEEPVYLLNLDSNNVAVCPWEIFVEYYDDLFYPGDRVAIFVDGVKWVVLIGPEEYVLLIEVGSVDRSLPFDDISYGIDLVRIVRDHEEQNSISGDEQEVEEPEN